MIEINKDFYCSADLFVSGRCMAIHDENGILPCKNQDCSCYHRKHLTLPQFKEEYGFEWTGAVYFNAWLKNGGTSMYITGEYEAMPLKEALGMAKALENRYNCVIVAACTPFIPNSEWRPE